MATRSEQAQETASPCFRCQRPTDGRREVHLSTRGKLVPIDEVVGDGEDQGWFPIGPECARKLPTGFVRRVSS